MLSNDVSMTALEAFGSVLDAPAGRVDSFPSGVTGKPLRYATPAKLSELLRRCQVSSSPEPPTSDPAVLVWLTPLGAYRASVGNIDGALARLLLEVAYGHASYKTREAVLRLGKVIYPSLQPVREENVFSGAMNASHAKHIYAPHDALPGLIEDLVGVLGQPQKNIDPFYFALVTAFYCSCVHPFKDGNGRWTRVMTMQAAVTAGGVESGATACMFLAMFYAELAGDIWPASFSQGLRRYLFLATAFKDALATQIESAPQKDSIENVLSTLKAYAPSHRVYQKAVVDAFTRNKLDLIDIKRRFGLSNRRVEGLAERFHEICDKYKVRILEEGPALIPDLWRIASKAKIVAQGEVA